MNGVDLYFVDSNVLLYVVDSRDTAKQRRAAGWLDQLWAAGTGRISWQVLHEFYWNATRKMRLEPLDARALVQDLAKWDPVDTTLGLMQQAWAWTDSAQLAYWDSLILAAAHRAGARYLLSEDFQDGREYGNVTCLSPWSP